MDTAKLEKASVEIKGYRGKLGLIIDEATPFEIIEDDLKELLHSKSSSQFFKGSQIILRPGHRQVSPSEYSQLRRILLEEGTMELCEQESGSSHILSQNSESSTPSFSFQNEEVPFNSPLSAIDEKQGHSLTHEAQVSDYQVVEKDALLPGFQMESALTLHQTLRSGKKLETDQSVFLIGDLNAGAEIISKKDIWVLGTIRGMVHAGSAGDVESRVFGLRVQPIQIRIAHLISEMPMDKKQNTAEEPELAFIKEGRIVIGPYRKLR